LGGLLGLSEEEIQRLEGEKVIGETPEFALPVDIMRQLVQLPLWSFQQMGAIAALEPDYKEQLGLA